MQAHMPAQQQPQQQLQQYMPAQHQEQTQSQHLYAQLLPIVRQVLQVLLVNEFEDTTLSVTMFILAFNWQDESNVAQWMSQHSPNADTILRGRILEAFAHWIRRKTKDLDYLVEMSQVGHPFVGDRLTELRQQLQQAAFQNNGSYAEIWADFLHSIVCELLGGDAACLGSVLSGMLVGEAGTDELLDAVTWPSSLLALLVRKLEEMQATLSKVVMEMYQGAEFLNYEQSKNVLMMFFQHYTVETVTGGLEVHTSGVDEAFCESLFRINLVDSFGSLMRLLRHLEFVTGSGEDVALAVDFEGVRLCRTGELCLMQLTCSDDPTLVYVLDVHVLGARTFTLQTQKGTSMKGLLEDQNIRKVWFDPRNDADALYHQFGIMPHGIFDLQLAEVADRRMRGLTVNFVQGLYRCLTQCPSMTPEQQVFAENINNLGKSLFEPQHGGTYEIFQQRPLNAMILIYAAHDSRYMLVLYDRYMSTIGARWAQRVLSAGERRGRWCLNQEYVLPGSEAPEF